MALNSFKFIICFAFLFVILIGAELSKKFIADKVVSRIQTTLMLVFSYALVYLADLRFLLCILFATITSYILGYCIQNAQSIKSKKLYLASGITVFVLMLGYFKYTNFFISSFCSLFNISANTLNIIMPIGISFYTFSIIAYLIDVYRNKYDAKTNVLDFSLYVVFFPKLVSGPIVRGKTFFPQLENYSGIKAKKFAQGLQIFVFGLFKKVVLADHLGIFVDNVYFAPKAFDTFTVVLAVISYSLQIYFDFSGYSDMAIGVSKMVGFDFEQNFNLPYTATSFSDFWKRWHISLSSWFAEYLYIPLGGSRKGTARTCMNLLIVMLVSGLWHGAGITFILWGLLYGIVSCIEHLVKKVFKTQSKGKTLSLIKALFVYIVVTLFWIPFRASDFSNMLDVLQCIFTVRDGVCHPYSWTFFAITCLLVSTIFAAVRSKKNNLKDKNGTPCIMGYYPVMDLTKFVPLCVFFTFVGLTIILGYFGNTAFIYGNF